MGPAWSRHLERINPLRLLLWTFRRREDDVVALYSSLSGIMRLATAGDMLNFGYWGGGSPSPLDAQRALCARFGRAALLAPGQRVVDVGSGCGAPAAQWRSQHDPIGIFSADINFGHLSGSPHGRALSVNATATALPFATSSADRVLALESAQHFRPLPGFVSESHRVLRDDGGRLTVAVPVTARRTRALSADLGLLSVTWPSEHYSKADVVSSIEGGGFDIELLEEVGDMVYGPLADYYDENRGLIRERVLGSYPGYVEGIVHRSVRRMRRASAEGVIDYLLIRCSKIPPGRRAP